MASEVEPSKPPATRQSEATLGIVLPDVTYRDGEHLILNRVTATLLEAIFERWPNWRLCLPLVAQRESHLNHPLTIPAERFTPLPPLTSTVAAQRHIWTVRHILLNFARDVDVILMKMPFQIPWCLTNLGKPKVLHVVSNPEAIVRVSTDYRGPMRWLANLYARHANHINRQLAHEPHTRTVTHGDEMWRLLDCRVGRVVVSSTLKQAEISPKTDFSLPGTPRILFVGYLRPEKGVGVLLDAFARLRQTRPLRLTLVGGLDRRSKVFEEVRRQIVRLDIADDVDLPGMVDFGPQLFDLYRSHDLVVVPSFSEGTPRTIVEARAFGCPVVATSVGGIPTVVQHGESGLLVPPGDVGALANAMASILDDESLRQRLIATGLQLAPQLTLECFADALIEELKLVSASTTSCP